MVSKLNLDQRHKLSTETVAHTQNSPPKETTMETSRRAIQHWDRLLRVLRGTPSLAVSKIGTNGGDKEEAGLQANSSSNLCYDFRKTLG